MTGKNRNHESVLSEDLASWLKDDFQPRKTPSTDDELDLLTRDTIESFSDIPSWKQLVVHVGITEATRILGNGIKKSQMDPDFLKPVL